MESTIVLNSEPSQEKAIKASSLKSQIFRSNRSFWPLITYVAFLATCLTLIYGELIISSILFFVFGNTGYGVLYIRSKASKIDTELSFKINVDQPQLENDLFHRNDRE